MTSLVAISRTFMSVLVIAASLQAAVQQTTPSSDAKNDTKYFQALELYHDGNLVDAMPLFEELAATYPKDAGIHESWAFCMMGYAATIPQPEERKKVRARARKIAIEAQRLGDNSPLLQTILQISEDGAESAYSNHAEVDAVMKEAEAEFVRGNFDKAREGYIRALLLDPNNYEAALFTGDVYFKQKVYGSAGEWFARAIQIDPNRETAYRYWGDSLFAMGKNEEARDKFIEAIVAEPYNMSPWQGAQAWAKHNQGQLHILQLQNKAQVDRKDDRTINITIDPSALGKKDDPMGAAWMAYGLSRASWQGEKFKKEFPNEPKYRHTMREEVESLTLMVDVLKGQKLNSVDSGLLELMKLSNAGLLEPYVLLNRADQQILLDYPAYRELHRDKVRQYLDDYVVPKAPHS
jgi:tetratricopeptide (TPR) repeat protein